VIELPEDEDAASWILIPERDGAVVSLKVPNEPEDAQLIEFGALIVILSAVLVDDGTLGDVAATWNV
jgi:hypothetical protein